MKEYPYWLDTVPRSSNAVPVPEPLPSNVDALVVGGGFTGLAAVRCLAKAGANVLLVERERIGCGASSRNGGQVLTGLKLDASALVARWGETHARKLLAVAAESMARLERLIADESIDCEYHRAGHIEAAAKPSHFDAFRGEQALLARLTGRHVDLVPRSEQRSEVGSDAYYGLLVDQQSAALNPAQYVEGLALAARRAGACIAAGVAMTRCERRDGQWEVATSGGAVRSKEVLLATDAYTDEAAPALRRRFVPIGSYIIATEPLSFEQAARILPRRRVAFDSRHFVHYFRLTTDRRLLFGGRAEFSEPSSDSTRRAAAILQRDLVGLFPELATVAIEYAWGGRVGFTLDQMPRAGMLDGLYYAGGYCGHGIAMATYLGEQIARRMAGERIENVLFDDDFDPIPFYSGAPWFLPVIGAYYQVKDWLS